MTLSPLKFSLGVSLVVHGVAIGGAILLGQFHRTDATIKTSETATLELIAAPSSPARVLEQVLAPVLPTPPVALPSQPAIQSVIPEKPAELPPVEEAILPQPAAQREPITPVATASVAVTAPQITTLPAPTPQRGDGSSATLGRDATTAEGKPTAKAQPDYLKNPEPVYPLAARRRHQEGLVVVNVRVSTAGRAMNVSLKQSSGYPLLDDAALTQVREWEFAPARIGSRAVESEIEVPVRFKLMP